MTLNLFLVKFDLLNEVFLQFLEMLQILIKGGKKVNQTLARRTKTGALNYLAASIALLHLTYLAVEILLFQCSLSFAK